MLRDIHSERGSAYPGQHLPWVLFFSGARLSPSESSGVPWRKAKRLIRRDSLSRRGLQTATNRRRLATFASRLAKADYASLSPREAHADREGDAHIVRTHRNGEKWSARYRRKSRDGTINYSSTFTLARCGARCRRILKRRRAEPRRCVHHELRLRCLTRDVIATIHLRVSRSACETTYTA